VNDNDQVSTVLEALVPSFADERPDWENVRARATPRPVRLPYWRRRPGVVIAAVLLLVIVALLATPAFGVQGFVLDLFGRKNVSFANSRSAPNEVKKQFEDLGIGGPARWAPEVIAARARVVATFTISGHPRKLWVAPTRRGGYCYTFEDSFGGCRQTEQDRSIGSKGQFGVTWSSRGRFVVVSGRSGRSGRSLTSYAVTRVGGDINAPTATKITVSYADGETASIPFVWVSKPIAAGFFTYDIPVAHWNEQHRVLALTLYGQNGHILAQQSFVYRTAPARRPPLRIHVITPPAALPAKPTVAPSEPLQRGSADGFAIVAGHNGSVEFTQVSSTPILKQLVGHSVGFICFRLATEFGIFTVRSVGHFGRFAPAVGTQFQGVGTPFDGCEIDASFGHRWPDPLGEHASVEIGFTKSGRRYFADRATARDLALFVRSQRMHQLRKEPAAQALKDIKATYGRELAHSPIRIKLVDPETLQFTETSPTGRHFQVTIRNGRISNQNVKPLGFVF
jgi:hypothetical protein